MLSGEIALKNSHYYYIMPYIMLAYLMLLAALSNDVCLYDAFSYYFFFLSFFLLG